MKRCDRKKRTVRSFLSRGRAEEEEERERREREERGQREREEKDDHTVSYQPKTDT